MGKNKASRTFAFALLSLVIVGLIGFGSSNLSGNIRTIGSVGGKDISVATYGNALQNEIRAIEAQSGQPFAFADAQLFGVDKQVLARLVNSRMLDAEAARIGISIGDDNLAQEIRNIESFQGMDGKFDREAYSFTLERAGLSEQDFEAQIRDDSARTILQAALLGRIQTNPVHGKAFAAYFAETRDVTWAQLTMADLEDAVATPTEEELTAYYEENIADYTLPETRRITYAWLTPDMILDTVEVNEDAMQAAYERRIDEFVRPERRIVERLVFADNASAEAALARINASEVTFEDLVAERGLELIDVDLGDVSKRDLGSAGEAVFAENKLGVVGPVDSSLGPALFRVNVILPGQETSFEDAIPALRMEVAYDRAARVIDDQITDFDDMLAAGATLEELAADTEMQLAQISWHPGVDAEIAAYAAFRDEAAVVSTADFPAIAQLEDGGVFAMRLDAIDDARPEEFDTVRDRISEAWLQDRQLEMLESQAEAAADNIRGGATLPEEGLDAVQEEGVSRRALIDGAPRELVAVAFEMSAGDVSVFKGDGAVYLLRLDAVSEGDLSSQDNQSLINAVLAQTNAGIEQDVFDAYSNLLRLRTEIDLDQQAIDAVHANFLQ